MSTALSRPSGLVEAYRRRTERSAELARQAGNVFPGGITHDARYFPPYPIYVARAEGPRKWDVDGNEYIDYVGGHGALLLGHTHPEVVAAVRHQLVQGTHPGACHPCELQWGQLVQQLIPSAERVRFTSSGTEATLLAFRLARAWTGKPKVLRFHTHFHGWHDHVAFGVGSHLDGTASTGVLPELAENVLLCPPGDVPSLRRLLADRTDLAAVILEPTGASWGQIPLPPGFLTAVRELTDQHEVILIFDEVITGFRCAPGGAQAVFGVRPDLTTLAKILAGGLPGGAVAGRRDLMELLDKDACAESGREKVAHYGTFNANPLSAVAGTATLKLVAASNACQRANDYAARLREGLAALFAERGLAWRVYGTFSGFHIFTNPHREAWTGDDLNQGRVDFRQIQAAAKDPVVDRLRLALAIEGVDIFRWPGGVTSAVHTETDLQETLAAFARAVQALQQTEQGRSHFS